MISIYQSSNRFTNDGEEHASMEAAEQYNKAYWDRMMIDISHKDYARYTEIEKAYFDCITLKFNINDKDILNKFLQHNKKKLLLI